MPRTMTPEIHPLIKLLCEDQRYKLDAYQFVRSGLAFAQEVLGLGGHPVAGDDAKAAEGNRVPRHVTGQDLCHALRQYAHEQYGFLAKPVLNHWGIHTTGDFGEIVYNLIKIGEMSKSEDDRREDFEQVFNFDQAFVQDFLIAARQKA